MESTFSTLSEHLYLSRLAVRPLTLIVMAETEKAPYYCCLASLVPLFTAKTLTVVLLTRSGENGHFTRWNVAVHGITCKHCSLLPWQRGLGFNLPARDFPNRKWLCSFLHPYCPLVFTLNHVIQCTLMLSCQHRSDCILCRRKKDSEIPAK